MGDRSKSWQRNEWKTWIDNSHTHASMHLKRYSPSFIIIEMQIKTTLRNHFLPMRLARKSRIMHSVGETVEAGSLISWC